MARIVILMVFGAMSLSGMAQDYRWQQRAEYVMDVRLDVKTNKVTGTQKLTYHNESRDTLRKVYYHLYYNAFQPGSMMDVRSRNLPDPDARIGDRISKLKDEDVGYQHIQSLKQDGRDLSYHIEGTILEVTLAKPLLPKSKTVFDMKFEGQVPAQIRRTGKNNKEGISYTMTQWYPKMAEYDFQGWHPYQYIAREFHGVWGDFDVKITLDPTFVVCGTGTLQNADKIGYGYEKPGTIVKRPEGELTWHFIARNVIDFAWAADPDYLHDRLQVPNGPELHFFYQPKSTENWKRAEPYAVRHFEFMNNTFGKYPYDSYAFIQGGDGGMEYPMCTMIMGEGAMPGIVGLMAHESAHSWFQGVLASNESLYPWLDEGFTDFAEAESMASLFNTDPSAAHAGNYTRFFTLIKRGQREPLSQHADYYNTDFGYKISAYSAGVVLLHQLKYIVGNENFFRGMKLYYNTWKMKHPEPNDFIRVMEKVSGMQLKWYMNFSLNTIRTIDYGIKAVVDNDEGTFVTLERVSDFPMPIDLLVTYKDGKKELIYIPINETLGGKPVEDNTIARTDLEPWPWVNPTYVLKLAKKASEIESIEIDPSQRMADVERKNNRVDLTKTLQAYERTLK